MINCHKFNNEKWVCVGEDYQLLDTGRKSDSSPAASKAEWMDTGCLSGLIMQTAEAFNDLHIHNNHTPLPSALVTPAL